jgi:phosphatidylinositol alpha-mannosyltransferase
MTTSALQTDAHAREVHPTRRRFNIAVFSYGLPCPGEKRGGIEQVAHDLANALVDRGHGVTVFTYDPRPSTARYQTGPLPGRTFVMTWLGRRVAMGYLGNLLALGPRYGGFDVILAHGDSLLLPFTGKPVVRVMHGSALEEALSSTSPGRAALQAGVYLQELVTALLQRGTVAVSANSRRFNPFIHRVIPDGIDLAVFHPDPRARSRQPSMLFVGALEGRKRGLWLLDRFEQVIRPAFPEAELHMVTTPGRPVTGVTYHTGITAEALVRLYQYAWVYASPSTYEGFGLPYVEAMACGTPVVATANPGSREVLDDGRFGRLVSDEEFLPEVCRLLADAGERRRAAREGLARASQYDITRSAALYEGVIEELVA